jgi:response regulator of citrate/malate metabolism
MAERGKPIPFSLREQIKADRQEKTVRQIANERAISKTTVQKYGGKFGTK